MSNLLHRSGDLILAVCKVDQFQKDRIIRNKYTILLRLMCESLWMIIIPIQKNEEEPNYIKVLQCSASLQPGELQGHIHQEITMSKLEN